MNERTNAQQLLVLLLCDARRTRAHAEIVYFKLHSKRKMFSIITNIECVMCEVKI